MKKLFFILSLITYFNVSSQTNKSRAISSGFSVLQEGYYPNFFGDNSIIVLSVENKKMTIYHNDETETNYDFLKVLGTEVDEDKNTWGRILSVDDEGKKCEIILIELSKSQYEKAQEEYYKYQLIIKYTDTYMMTNMNSL